MSDIDITSATMDILQGPMMTTNEAAERLWEAIDANWEDSQPPRELFDKAFATERRATVELATAVVNDIPEYADGFNTCYFCSYASHERDGHAPDCAWRKARAILDEEAAR